MFVFFDGAIATALSLFVAMTLGAYAEAHPDWWIFRNEMVLMVIEVALTAGLTIGGVAAGIACVEHSLPLLAWGPVYAAIQIATALLFRLVRPLLRPHRGTIAT